MRDESEIEAMGNRVSRVITGGKIDPMDRTTLIGADGKSYEVERLRGILDALDWAIGDREDDLL